MEYEGLRKIAHKISRNGKITHMDNLIRDIEENIKNKPGMHTRSLDHKRTVSNHKRNFEEAQIMRSCLRKKNHRLDGKTASKIC